MPPCDEGGPPLKALIYVVPIFAILAAGDHWLTDDHYIGWERNSVRNSLRRWENDTRAKVAIMGSSTSKDWLPGSYLERLMGLKRGELIDAHINGCHQGCTWAEIRRIRQRHRVKRCRWKGKDRCSPPKAKRFEAVFFGTNLFQMCENAHSKRTLQHTMLLPTVEAPLLFNLYASAKTPLLHMGRYVGMKMSGAYGDTRALRDYWGQKWVGKPHRGKEHLWYRATKPKTEKDVLSCDYRPENVALKLAYSAAMLDDLKELSAVTYLMLLPDRSRLLKDPEHQRRWAAHISAHKALVADRPWVKLVDLTDSATSARDFRDGFHLTKGGFKKQRKLFEARLRSLGALTTKEVAPR